jgi:hypothetical protein
MPTLEIPGEPYSPDTLRAYPESGVLPDVSRRGQVQETYRSLFPHLSEAETQGWALHVAKVHQFEIGVAAALRMAPCTGSYIRGSSFPALFVGTLAWSEMLSASEAWRPGG